MPKFSANLGLLWSEMPLPDAIRAAHAAGFDAVECHWPYDVPAQETKHALDETGLPMLGLNTSRGAVQAGEFGLSALPAQRPKARAAIDQALEYARAIGCSAVHVMAGCASGAEAEICFLENLHYATEGAAKSGITILIEPLNATDVPGYFLNSNAQAVDILDALGATNAKLMFDCYHTGMSGGDVTAQLNALMPHIGHIQFACVPGRGAPFQGRVAYREIFALLDRLGYQRALGAEYRPEGATEASLDWLREMTS